MKRALLIGAALALAATASAAEPSKPAVTATPPPSHQKIDKNSPLAPSPAKPIKIDSERFEALDGGKQMTWNGHVLIVREALRVSCDALVGEGADPSHLDKLTCTGHVHMEEPAVPDKHPDREAWGEKAVFENELGLLTMTGTPRFREGDNRMKADRVLYDTNLDRVNGEGHVSMDVTPPPDRDPAAKPKPSAKEPPKPSPKEPKK